MAKWKKSTLMRRARQKKRFEKYMRDLAASIEKVMSLSRKKPVDLYEEEHDYELMGGS